MNTFWQNISHELEQGYRVFIAIVADCSKGSPGTTGAQLFCSQRGKHGGTIGGGIMERQVLDWAVQSLNKSDFPPELHKITHQKSAISPSGLICGGSQTNVVAVLKPEHDQQMVERICLAIENELPAEISISASGLNLTHLRQPLGYASALNDDPISWKLSVNTINLKRVLICGAGHCGQALARQMTRLGYRTTLVDERDSIPGLDSLPVECERHLGPNALKEIQGLVHIKRSITIVMTHSYPTDLKALAEILPANPAFVGLMGSALKLKAIYKSLEDHGFIESQIKSIKAPIGLPIGSDTPEEIAVSISAQILLERNQHQANEHEKEHYLFAQ